MPKKSKQRSLKETTEILAQIAEKHLATMPEEEQEERVAALARRTSTSHRGTPSTHSKIECRQGSRAFARGHE